MVCALFHETQHTSLFTGLVPSLHPTLFRCTLLSFITHHPPLMALVIEVAPFCHILANTIAAQVEENDLHTIIATQSHRLHCPSLPALHSLHLAILTLED